MDDAIVQTFIHEGQVYVNVKEFVAVIIADLRKAPPDMVSTRDEIIFALQRYVDASTVDVVDL